MVLGLFEKFENRLAGQNRGLPNFSALADLAVPKIGFRQCIFWETQNWPNGPASTLKQVPPVFPEGSASLLQNFYFLFSTF